jgi:3-oxoacyl-[acyl-carrier-protein] synthase III
MVCAKIAGTGAYLPEKVLTNAELSQTVDTSDEWIKKRAGISERRIAAQDQTTLDIALPAARNALESAGLTANDIDMVVVATSTPQMHFPSTACFLAHALGVTNEAPAFDMNAACGGFVYALSVADQFIKSGAKNNILIVGVDLLSRLVDWQDRGTCVLFGDGAGAVVLSAAEDAGVHATHIFADGKYTDQLFANNSLCGSSDNQFIQMQGAETFKLAVTKMGEVVEHTLAESNFSHADIDWLIPHQANIRIIQALAKKLDMPMEKVIATIGEHGNTSAASIPLALDYAVRSDKVKRGDLLLLEAFGAGFTWGAALITY